MVKKNYEYTKHNFVIENKHHRIFADSRIKYETNWMGTTKRDIKRMYIISQKAHPILYTIEMILSNNQKDFIPIGTYSTLHEAMNKMQFILSGDVNECYSDMNRKKSMSSKPKRCNCKKNKK